MNSKSSHLFAVAFLTLCLAIGANAQGYGTIDSGTSITVRTNEEINAKDTDGRVYSGIVEKDVMNNDGMIAIPKGSDVELIVKKTSKDEVALDLASVMVNGQRYGVETEDRFLNSERKEGIGANKRTGKYVGGGAAIGAIIGAIAGGGKGAAIGAGAGAAAGAGAQILTRGQSVHVPAESLLTFRLQQPLRTGAADYGYTRNGRHYHPGYSSDSRSYGDGSVRIGRDNNITWYAPAMARVYVQVDNNPVQLFAEGQSGTQAAPWIKDGHVYLFILRDMSGNEIARDRMDTRQYRNSYRSR
jgi:hypothetical protein